MLSVDDAEPHPGKPAPPAKQQPMGFEHMLKYSALFLLVFQNSGLFVLTRYTRLTDGPMYLSTVVVLLTEVAKLIFCLMCGLAAKMRTIRPPPQAHLYPRCPHRMVCSDGLTPGLERLRQELWHDREVTSRLSIPAICYTIQNNLVFMAVANLSAAAAQVLYQSKTLSTAFFSVLLLSKKFSRQQWLSFVFLTAGVVLVQNQDAKSATTPTGGSPLLGVCAALGAAGLSGFAGVYLELMFTSGASSLWMRNVQLCLFSIPLQMLAVITQDAAVLKAHGLFHGFHQSTWALVALQFAGGMLAAVVIKYAGNILKTFATVLAILCTCFVSVPLFSFQPTPLFWGGVVVVSFSVWMYAWR